MRGLQVWSEGRKRRVGAALKGLPWVARGGKHGKGAAAAGGARGCGQWALHASETADLEVEGKGVLVVKGFVRGGDNAAHTHTHPV